MGRDGKGFNWSTNQGRRYWSRTSLRTFYNLNVDQYIFQLDGAWALWGNISRPQVPDERLNSYYSWLIYFSHFFRRQNDVLLQCGGAAIKSRQCTIVRSLSQMCWVLGLQFHMSSIWNYLLEYVLKLTISKWIGFGNMVPLADQSIMEEKGERWKVLSLTHVEYKVANHDLYQWKIPSRLVGEFLP